MKKPELLVTPTCLMDIEPLIVAGADAFLIGEARYGLRLAGEFTREDIRSAVQLAHRFQKKIYVAMNAIFHNEAIDELNGYIAFLEQAEVDAVVFGDPAVLLSVREAAPNMPLHWNAETIATNYFTCNYWGEKGAKRAVLARELGMEEILEVKENANVEIEIQVQGMTCMFQSKRKLIDNYMNFQGKDMPLIADSKASYLHDKERDVCYPIFQDTNGTHIMSPNDICMIEELNELVESGIDCFKIDGVLKKPEYLIEVTKIYRKAIDLAVLDLASYEAVKTDLNAEIEHLQPKNRPLDTGFYFKETVY